MSTFMPYYKERPVFGPRGPAGPDGNPIGTIISFMGTSAPKDYLICDGAQYSISQHPALSNFFEEQFGAKNHFGGDGSSTFAVPDTRNLFLRGYHGDAEKQLSGLIGEKQEGTQFPSVFVLDGARGGIGSIQSNQNKFIGPTDRDSDIDSLSEFYRSVPYEGAYNTSLLDDGRTDLRNDKYTARPVNMAVLYCIKAVESTTGGNSAGEIYSTDETRIGTWIDGKPLYRKVFSLKVPSDVSSVNSSEWVHYDASVDLCVKINGIIKRTSQQIYEIPYYISGDNFLWVGYNLPVHATSPNSVRIIGRSNLANAPACVIMEYTKTTD